jgi:hypothetical protein
MQQVSRPKHVARESLLLPAIPCGMHADMPQALSNTNWTDRSISVCVCVCLSLSCSVFIPDKLGDTFNQQDMPLRYTPRRSVAHGNHLVTIECDHKSVPVEQRPSLKGLKTEMDVVAANNDNDTAEDEDWEREQRVVPVKSASGTWASCAQVYGLHDGSREIIHTVELGENEAALGYVVHCSRSCSCGCSCRW